MKLQANLAMLWAYPSQPQAWSLWRWIWLAAWDGLSRIHSFRSALTRSGIGSDIVNNTKEQRGDTANPNSGSLEWVLRYLAQSIAPQGESLSPQSSSGRMCHSENLSKHFGGILHIGNDATLATIAEHRAMRPESGDFHYAC